MYVKNWKEPECPLTREWINKLWYNHTVEFYSAIKRSNYWCDLNDSRTHSIRWEEPCPTGYIHTTWFHLYNTLKKVKLSGKNRLAVTKAWGWKGSSLEGGMGEILRVMEVLYIWTVVAAAWLNELVKIHRSMH